jgi:hypothetical protein
VPSGCGTQKLRLQHYATDAPPPRAELSRVQGSSLSRRPARVPLSISCFGQWNRTREPCRTPTKQPCASTTSIRVGGRHRLDWPSPASCSRSGWQGRGAGPAAATAALGSACRRGRRAHPPILARTAYGRRTAAGLLQPPFVCFAGVACSEWSRSEERGCQLPKRFQPQRPRGDPCGRCGLARRSPASGCCCWVFLGGRCSSRAAGGPPRSSPPGRS